MRQLVLGPCHVNFVLDSCCANHPGSASRHSASPRKRKGSADYERREGERRLREERELADLEFAASFTSQALEGQALRPVHPSACAAGTERYSLRHGP